MVPRVSRTTIRQDDAIHMAMPLPPLEMRQLVGPTDEAAFDNPSGDLVFSYLPATSYRHVFDFGCGCGRIARQLMQQQEAPEKYVGIDVHRGMIKWCKEKLQPHAPNFEFVHHDVFNGYFNPRAARDVLPFPVHDRWATLVNAYSVFTHLTQGEAEFYLNEVGRILAPDGVFHSTWFLFDRREFPMLQRSASALYVSYEQPSAAVLFDRAWLEEQAKNAGLAIANVIPPAFRGYQWTLVMEHAAAGVTGVPLPADTSPLGEIKLPDLPDKPHRIGLRRPFSRKRGPRA
jgi:SAM-dependent methyltransferase